MRESETHQTRRSARLEALHARRAKFQSLERAVEAAVSEEQTPSVTDAGYLARLQESESKLRSIFQATFVGIGLMSNRVLLEVNDRFCQMVGYPREELIGHSARMLYATQEDYDYVGREKMDRSRNGAPAPSKPAGSEKTAR